MKTLIKTEWRLLLFGFLMTFWSSPGQTFLLSLFSGDIRSALGLSHGEFGGLYSLANLLSAAVIIWSGTLVDKMPLRRFACLVVVALAASLWLLSAAYSIAALFIALFLTRQFGQSLMMLTATTTLVRYLDHHKGKAVALGGMGFHMAEAIMPSVVIFLIAAVGWRMGLQSIGVFLLLALLPTIWLLLNNHGQRHRRYIESLGQHNDEDLQVAGKTMSGNTGSRKQWSRSEVLRDIRFYLFMPALVAQPMLFTGFIFHQIHLIETKSWSLELWGALFFMYAMVSIASKLVTGFVVDRVGAIRLLPYVALPMGAGLLVLATSSHIAVGIAFLFLMGMTMGAQTTVSGPFWSEMYGSQSLGSIKSLASALISFSTALTPFAMGWLIDRGVSIDTLAVCSAVYIGLASVVAFYARHLVQRGLTTE